MHPSERNERRMGNNKASSNLIATSYLHAKIKQYFGESGSAVVCWLQVGQGERPIFDDVCKSWLLSPEHLAEVQQEANKEPFSAFSPEHEKWVQTTIDCYRTLVMAL